MKNIGMKKFGMKKIIMKTTFTPIAALLIFLSISATPTYAAVVGRVLVSTGDSVAIRNGQEVRLRFGSQIEDKDTLRTGAAGSLQVRFTDQSIVALREKSTFKLEQYAYSKEKGSIQTAIFNLIKGGFRTITGLISKSNQSSYSVKTAAATIGIRGTHYAVRVCEDDCINPDGSNAKDGVYGSVLSASDKDSRIVINNLSGEKEFSRYEHFYVENEKSTPQTLLVPPSFVADNLKGRGQIAEKSRQDDGQDEDKGRGEAKGGTNRDSRPNMIARTFESDVTITDPNCTTGDCSNLPPPPLQRGAVVIKDKVGHMAGLSTSSSTPSTGLISRNDQLTLQPTGELIRVEQSFSGQIASHVLDIGSAHNIGTGRNAAAGNLAWGAWMGTGITDHSTSANGTLTNPLDSFVYIYGDAAGALPNRITATYQPIGGVAIDLSGNTGKIMGGNISVDFFLQQLLLNKLTVGMGNRSFTYNTVTPVAIGNGAFNDFGTASCTGTVACAPSYSFKASGIFTGADAQGIGLHYDLVSLNDQITGVEGFLRTDYAPVTAGVLTAYAGGTTTAPYAVADNDAIRLSTERTLNTDGNLVAYNTALGDSASIATGVPAVDIGIGGPAGDHFGRWNGGSITGNSADDAGLPTPTSPPISGVHYLYTAALTLPEVIAAKTGTVNFSRTGGTTPTNHLGSGGAFGGGNLSVDFTKHTAAMTASWSAGQDALGSPITYNLTATPLKLFVDGSGAHFGEVLNNHSTAICSACSDVNGTIDQLNIEGNFSGAAGNTINMAISTFDVGVTTPVTSASVQVFQAPAQ